MMQLVSGVHRVHGGTMFELRNGEQLVACIYPTEDGLKIVSKYIVNDPRLVMIEVQEPPAILIDLTQGMVEEVASRRAENANGVVPGTTSGGTRSRGGPRSAGGGS